MIGKKFLKKKDKWSSVENIIEEEIYERMKGEKGYLDKSVVLVDE